MDQEARLIDKLRKIEALFARPGTDGERAAAEEALGRIQERLEALRDEGASKEYRFSMRDAWSKALFIALLRRYGLEPYRYRGQRRTTVMVDAPEQFVEETLWPEFQEVNAVLRDHLQSVTKRVISEVFSDDDSDVEERETALLGTERRPESVHPRVR